MPRRMYRLEIIILFCFFGLGCQNKTDQLYIEDYLKITEYDSSSIVGYEKDVISYYKNSCSLYFRKISCKKDLIYSEFINPIVTQWKNNSNTVMLESSLKNKEFEYEMYDSLNGYIYEKGLIANDTLIIMEIRTKNIDCEFYKLKDKLKLSK